MLRSILIAGLLVGVAVPAFAAEYYIVRGPDKKCQIVEKRPSNTKMVIVGDKAFVSREEAQKQLTVVCKD